jgi:zinc D-Ala-D-Ala carboxypeptidase
MTAAPISRNQCQVWLRGIASGVLDLTRDNEGMAAATLALLAPAPQPGPEPAPLPDGYLSPHFSLAELTYSQTAVDNGIDNTPDDDELAELTKTADLLEEIRTLCRNAPVTVSSGFRCEEVNQLVGGATNSAHRWGGAADIEVPLIGDPLVVCFKIFPHMAELGIDQLIYESGGGAYWVHVGRPAPGSGARCQAFSIVDGQTVSYPFPDGPRGVSSSG